jgi:CHAT domain-containing protein
LHSAGLAWEQLPFAITFSPFLWQQVAAVPLKCVSLGFGTADKGAIDLAEEAEDFAAVFERDGRQFSGSKAHLEDALASDGIVLVSCHGSLAKDAFGPRVFFQLEDGSFELKEAMPSGRTSSALVILSACDSGAYEMLGGDYPVGAAPFLLIAGAKNCACARFPVDAVFSREFFCEFGRRLRAQDPVAVSFTSAMDYMDQQGYDLWRHLACVELLARGD